MYKVQYKAGYFSESILDLFISDVEKQKIKDIVNYLCHFSVETSESIKHVDSLYSPEIKIINNIISRGVPSPTSLYLEEILSSTLGYNSRLLSTSGKISYPFNNDELLSELRKALHIIDPRVTKENQTEQISDAEWKDKDKSLHLNFKYSFVPEYLGTAFMQLVDSNRPYESFIESSNYIGSKRSLRKQYETIFKTKTDFSLEMPYEYQKSKGIVIELDDSPTNTNYDYELERLKQGFCKDLVFSEPLLIDSQDNPGRSEMMRPLVNFTYNEYFDTITKNYRSPLYNSDLGLDAMQYALSPLAVARLEKTIIEYLLSGKLNLLDQKWHIAVIERDIPCAHLAFQDLKLHFENLFALKGDNLKFPEINLDIYRTAEFSRAKLNSVYTGNLDLLENFNEKEEYDLLIDISVIQRSGINNKPYETAAKNLATIKSVTTAISDNKFLTGKTVKYTDILSEDVEPKIINKASKAIKFFLNNIFRQEDFSQGQLELTNKIFQRKNVLGMFPNSAERNLPYHLAAMLQAGVNIIISPIMSMMLERVETLKKYNLNNISTLNNAIKDKYELNTKLEQISNGEFQFVFVSPDFLHKKNFRDVSRAMSDKKVYVNQFVIDEARCLSEFSNDFQPMYNDLGKIKNLLLKPTNKQNIPNVALSSIASYTVINDIKKAVNIADDDVVKVIQDSSQINFKMIDTGSSKIRPYMDIETIHSIVGSNKQQEITSLVKELYTSNENNEKSLIYCPDAYGKMGITDKLNEGMFEKLDASLKNMSVGYFLGNTDVSLDNVPLCDAKKSEQYFIKFINSKLDVLVSTKAFGIGTHNPDISNIIFFSPPLSTENFIQQIYGADKNNKSVNCFLTVDKHKFIVPKNDPVLEYMNTDECNYDRYIAYHSVLNIYKGKEKELSIIKELLYNINNSTCTYKDIIGKELAFEYQVDIELELLPKDNPNKLYVNEKGKTYGYLNLDSLDTSSSDTNFNQQLSQEIVDFVAMELEKRSHIAENIALMLQQIIAIKPGKGIVADTEKLKQGESIEIAIPYENDSIKKITHILNNSYPNIYNEHFVRNTYKKSNSVHSFLKQLSKIKKVENRRKLKNEISRIYQSVRLKQDTSLAINRLTKLGIIQDFVIDDINHMYIVRLTKIDKETVSVKLSDIFGEYLVKSKCEEYKQSISNISSNFIDESIKVYLDFCYEYIVKERLNSVDNIHSILSELANHKVINSDINNKLNKYLNSYFTGKYSSPLLASTQDNFLSLEFKNIEDVQKHINQMGDLKENWLQLMNSAKIVLQNDEHNYIAELIDSHAELILGDNSELSIDSSLEKAARGFIKMRKQKQFNIDEYSGEIQKFLINMSRIKPDLNELHENLMWLKLHRVWLKEYNKRKD